MDDDARDGLAVRQARRHPALSRVRRAIDAAPPSRAVAVVRLARSEPHTFGFDGATATAPVDATASCSNAALKLPPPSVVFMRPPVASAT
jgi:hypothetical protein